MGISRVAVERDLDDGQTVASGVVRAPGELGRARPVAEAGPASSSEPGGEFSASERRARAAGLRALLLARQGRFDGARRAFAEAAILDPLLDLSAIPTFWELARGGHEAAIAAYRDAGRDREALLLAARVEQTFRPRLAPSFGGAGRVGPSSIAAEREPRAVAAAPGGVSGRAPRVGRSLPRFTGRSAIGDGPEEGENRSGRKTVAETGG